MPVTADTTCHKITQPTSPTISVLINQPAADLISPVEHSCRAPVPWRSAEAEERLTGQRLTAEPARQAGDEAVVDARPLAGNGYKVPMTRAVLERVVLTLGGIQAPA